MTWRSVLPRDPIVNFPVISGDLRECVSPYDSEYEFDDM